MRRLLAAFLRVRPALGVMVVGLGTIPAHADITYVDAQEGAAGNTYATGGSLPDISWIDTTSNSSNTNDTDWMKRSGGSPGWSEHNGGDVIQGSVSGFPNTLGEITTEITGLPDGTYDVWVFFWEQTVSGTQNWVIDAGLTSGSLSSYSSPAGPVGGTDSTSAVDAATLTFSNAPRVTGAGGNQTMYGVNLGPVVVAGGSSIKVHVDKLLGTGSNNRTIFDGVGYELTSPAGPDTDGDGLPDSYEQTIIDADGGDLVNGFEDVMGTGAAPAVTDFDGDGADDAREYADQTDPLDEDSDDDGFHDGAETNDGTFSSYDYVTNTGDTGTDPLDDDSDDDSLLDGVESNTGVFVDANDTGTHPLVADSDQDGTADGVEVAQGTDPNDPSSNLTDHLFGIDFNRSDTFSSPSQSRFRIVSGSATQAENNSSHVKQIGSLAVTVSRPDTLALEFRGANGDSTRAIPGGDTSLSFLVADFIATRAGALDLQVSGLPAGNYVFRSYHLDTFTGATLGYAQGSSATTPNTVEARVGGVLMGSVQANGLGTAGLNTTFIADTQVPTLSFAFSHDGLAPLVINLTATESNGGDSHLLLNGFELFLSATP